MRQVPTWCAETPSPRRPAGRRASAPARDRTERRSRGSTRSHIPAHASRVPPRSGAESRQVHSWSAAPSSRMPLLLLQHRQSPRARRLPSAAAAACAPATRPSPAAPQSPLRVHSRESTAGFRCWRRQSTTTAPPLPRAGTAASSRDPENSRGAAWSGDAGGRSRSENVSRATERCA